MTSEPQHDLHRSPPVTLREIRQRWPWLAPVALALFALLGLAAATHGGAALVWDGPITRAFVALRSPAVDRVALWVSRLGSTPVVFAAGAAGIALAARRCRSVALVMLVTVTARPLVEWIVKELVARPRPTGARLVAGTGFSYPSGHVLAAAATWGFVPLIAALYVRRRWLWWMLTVLSWVIVVSVAWSRVWLGVHWTSDVVGGLALAFGALSVAEAAIDSIDRRHRRPPDRSRGREADLGEDPVAVASGRMDLDLVAHAGFDELARDGEAGAVR
ncbi:MAG TPA: phosphatase PAP2 family protein [Acidimicrobiales bacterium]|nr:phosphatase PAP2 family protein [Acidimicrobiales bacterium]